MSNTIFKILAHSYLRHQHQNQLIEDCVSALSSCLHELMSKVIVEVSQIEEVLTDHKPNNMSIILEEETERDGSEDEQNTYEQWAEKIKTRFNMEIKTLKKVQEQIDKLTSIYKLELKDLSLQLTKWEDKNKQYQTKQSKLKKLNQTLKKENQELKDQIANNVQAMMPEIQCENIFQLKDREHKKALSSSKTKKIQNEQIICSGCKNKENSGNSMNKSKEQKKWTILSSKVAELKNKMETYQKQINQKDEIIQKMTIKLRKENSIEDEQKKKLKTANTTLRGEKTLMINQLNTLKKTLAEKTQICDIQASELKRAQLELQNVKGTMKWQNSTINDLRTSIPKVSQKQSQDKLEKWNSKLFYILEEEQKNLQKIQTTINQIEKGYERKLGKMKDKLSQMETILDEKNEVIIKLKTKSNSEKTTAYYNDLVKVLSKKLAQKDQTIQQLKSHST